MAQQALPNGAIGNCTTYTLDLKGTNNYSGDFMSVSSKPDRAVEAGKVTTFKHEGLPPKGSMAGVAYHASGHQWVLAWSVPHSNGGCVNKVYVEDGDDVAEIYWEAIEQKLELAGDTSSSPGATAVILPSDDKGKAQLAAVFRDPPA